MDTSAQFVLIAKRILRELRCRDATLTAISERLSKQKHAIGTEDKREEQDKDIQPPWLNPVLAAYEQSERKKKCNEDRQYSVQNSIRIATWCAFGAVIIYAGVTLLIWCANQKAADAAKLAADTTYAQLFLNKKASDVTLSQMQAQTSAQQTAANASKTSASAALTQATTTETSLRATIDNFHLEQRAWVLATRFSLSAEPVIGRPCTVTVDLVNNGKTPALRVWSFDQDVHIMALYGGSQYPPYMEMPDYLTGSLSMVAPGPTGVMNISQCGPFTASELSSYTQRISKLYLITRIYYADVFKRGHWTNVCAYHVYGTPLDLFLHCNKENEIDENK